MAEQVVKAPMRGRVIRVHVQKGASVKLRDKLCDLEALKMEVPIMSPVAGTIKDVQAAAGQNVQGGDTLFVIEA